MVGLLDRIGFAFQVNWHSAGQWLLYAEGWQTSTPTADDPIYYAMSGNLDDPAIDEFHPGLSSDVLYVTNGETTDYAHAVTGALAWTPELSEGCDGCGFVFPDDDALVQEEFERILPFASSVARSAVDPDDPKTVTGIETKPFYVDSDDPYKSGNPGVQLSFTKSYGDPQPVAVIAKRSLGAVKVKYRINGGEVQTGADDGEWEGGSKYNPASVYYHQMRGVVTGTDPGDSVEVWFEGGGQRVSRSPTTPSPRPATGCSSWRPRTTPAPRRCRTRGPALRRHVHRRPGRQRPAGRRLRHRRRGTGRPGRPRRAQPLRRRRLGDRQRPGHPHRRPRRRQRRPAGARRAARVPLVHERGRQGAARRRLRRPAVHHAPSATSCTTPRARSPATRCPRARTRGAACRCGARSSVATPPTTCCSTTWAATSPWPTTATSDGAAFDSVGVDDPFTGLVVGPRRSRLRGQHVPEVVVPRDQRHPAGRPVQAVRELALGAVRQAGRTVRPAHRRPVRLLADRRRLLQEADPRDRGAGRRWVDDLLDVVRHRSRLGPPVRRGAHPRR